MWSWMFYVSSGVCAALLAAHLMNRKARQAPSAQAEQKPVPSTTNIEINIHPSLCHFWCPFCDASAEDLEQSQQLEELARRLAALYEASNAENDAADVDRHLAFARYLVETGRLTDDL